MKQEKRITFIEGEQEDGTYVVKLRNQNKIMLGDDPLKYVTLTEPDVAQLKGVSLLAINQSNVDQLKRLLPKISSPVIPPSMINKLKLSDLNRLAGGIMHFLYASEIDSGF